MDVANYGLTLFLHLYFSQWEHPDSCWFFYNNFFANIKNKRSQKGRDKAKYVAVYKIMFASLETRSIPTLLPAHTSPVLSLKGDPPSSDSPPISFSYALTRLPRYVLLLIWRLWHFNFHLTRPAYIIFIIQASLLAATHPPTVSLPRPLQTDRVTLAPQMSGFYRGEGL